MKRLPYLLAMMFALGTQSADAGYPGNGFWGVQSARKSNDGEGQPKRSRRVSRPLDIYPAYDPHYDNGLYSRGLTPGGGSAYMNHNYNGRAAPVSYSYWDGGFNPNGSLYGLSNYPHYDRPGFSYWLGGQ